MHSFRRFVKTVLSDNISAEYSEWFLGHAKSSYWTKDPEHKAAEYIRVMKYLTFLDYSTLESTGKGIQNQLIEKEEEIRGLRQELKSYKEQISVHNDRMDRLEEMMKDMAENRRRIDKLAKS